MSAEPDMDEEFAFPSIGSIFSSPPARKAIHRGQIHFRESYPSELMDMPVECETIPQSNLIQRAEIDAVACKAEPCLLIVPSPDGAFRAYLDVCSIDFTGRLAFHEVKSIRGALKTKIRRRAEQIRAYVEQNGADYYFWLNKDLYDSTITKNLTQLERYRTGWLNGSGAEHILEYVRRHRICTIADVMCEIHMVDHLEIYALIRANKLVADLTIALGYETRLRLPTWKLRLDASDILEQSGVSMTLPEHMCTGPVPSFHEAGDPIFQSILHRPAQKTFPWERAERLTPKERLLARIPTNSNHELVAWL